MCGRFQGVVNVEEKGVLHVGDENPEGPILAVREGPCVKVRVIVQLFGGLEDAGSSRDLDHIQVV